MDQANGLRSLMQEKRMKLLPEGLLFPVYVFVRVQSIPEKENTYAREFSKRLVAQGKRVLLLGESLSPNQPELTQTGWVEASFSTLERERWRTEDFENFGINSIVVDAGTGVSESSAYLHSESFQTTLITGGSEKDRLETQGMARMLSRRMGVKKMNVIVQGLYDSKEANRLFTKIYDGTKRLCAAELRYSGAFAGAAPGEEKLIGKRQDQVFLINSS